MIFDSDAQVSKPERLAYWYFRLNGFMTIEDFAVHDETRSHPRTDVDIIATRFRHRQENYLYPMEDDPAVAECDTFANVIIAEIKTGWCRLNGPWTDPNKENMHRVLRAIGCVSEAGVDEAAGLLYQRGRWANEIATVRIFAIGERKAPVLQCGIEQQLDWNHLIDFCIRRFRQYERQKRGNVPGSV